MGSVRQCDCLASPVAGTARCIHPRCVPRCVTSGARSASGDNPVKMAHRSCRWSRHSQGSSNQRTGAVSGVVLCWASSRSTPGRKRTSTQVSGLLDCYPQGSWAAPRSRDRLFLGMVHSCSGKAEAAEGTHRRTLAGALRYRKGVAPLPRSASEEVVMHAASLDHQSWPTGSLAGT